MKTDLTYPHHPKISLCKQLKKTLSESEEKYQNLYQNLVERTRDGIIIIRHGIIRESNSSWAIMCNCSIEDMLGVSFTNFFQPDDIPLILSLCNGRVNGEDAIRTHRTTLIHKDGCTVDVEIDAGPVTYHGKPAELVIIRDISDRRKIKKEVLKAKRLESIAALSGGIAHDYNNLLTGIIGNISLAQTYLKSDERVFNLLCEAQNASMIAKELTQKLITFSKGGSPTKKTVSISPLLKGVTEFSLSGSNTRYEYAIPDNLLPVDIDATQIGHVIHNIVTNAREAMPDGGIIKVTAKNVFIGKDGFLAMEKGKYVKISIKDHGAGISEDHMENIFDPYFSTKEMGAQKGVGLGLSISHSIIKQHNGEIALESQDGIGTTVFLYIPASEKELPENKPTEIPLKKEAEENPVAGKGNILVMDDEQLIRDTVGHMLSYLGYEVVFSKDGDEAIEVYKNAKKSQKPFAAVILDLTIRGGMGGKKTMRMLLDIDPDIKGIVSSGYSNDPVMADFKNYGFSGVVAKPFSIQELSKELSDVITGNTIA